MSDEESGVSGFQPGRTSALDYFRKFNGSIGENNGGSGGGDNDHVGKGSGQTYWFIYGRQCKKQILAGPYGTQEEARKNASEKFSGWSYRVLGMPTRDRGRARQMLSHEIAKGGSVADSFKKMQREV